MANPESSDPLEKKEAETPSESQAPIQPESSRVEDASAKLEASIGNGCVIGDLPVMPAKEDSAPRDEKAPAQGVSVLADQRGDQAGVCDESGFPKNLSIPESAMDKVRKGAINVLIVDAASEMRKFFQEALKLVGLKRNNIFETGSVDEALNIVINGISDQRNRIGWVLSDAQVKSKDDGAILLGELKALGKGQLRPYLTGMGKLQNGSPTFEEIKKNADEYIEKGADLNFAVKLIESLEKAWNHSNGIVEGRPSDVEEDGDAPIIEGGVPEKEVAVPESGKQNYYQRRNSLRDLTNPDAFPEGTRVALLDVDGTLAEPFIMGRFARHLANYFPTLLKMLPPNQRKKNRQALKGLLSTVESIEKGTYPKNKPYEEMIQEMDRLYMEALVGLSVKSVCDIGAEFSRTDAQIRLYKFAKPLIEMLKYLGVVPTLVTGMPAEALSGYINALGGIEARSYPLELHTVQAEGKGEGQEPQLYYSDKISREAGLSKEKAVIARSIATSGNDIFCAFGDQKSDLGMMRVAMEKKGEIAYGKAFYLAKTKSSEIVQHVTQVSESMEYSYDRRHVVMLDKGWETFAMLESIAHELFRMERWFQYKEGVAEATREYRDRLHELIFHPQGKADAKGNPYERRGGFKRFIPEGK